VASFLLAFDKDGRTPLVHHHMSKGAPPQQYECVAECSTSGHYWPLLDQYMYASYFVQSTMPTTIRAHTYGDYFAALIFSVNSGTAVKRSATRPASAIWKMGASAS
jgi:hypothetical protein